MSPSIGHSCLGPKRIAKDCQMPPRKRRCPTQFSLKLGHSNAVGYPTLRNNYNNGNQYGAASPSLFNDATQSELRHANLEPSWPTNSPYCVVSNILGSVMVGSCRIPSHKRAYQGGRTEQASNCSVDRKDAVACRSACHALAACRTNSRQHQNADARCGFARRGRGASANPAGSRVVLDW